MSKYYKAEDVQILINSLKCYGIPELNLDGLPTIEVSEDCISREYLLSKVYDMDNDNLVVDCKDIKDAPSVVPKDHSGKSTEMVGEWIVYPLMDEGRVELECPKCGDTFIRAVDYRPHFCENCGAKMKG